MRARHGNRTAIGAVLLVVTGAIGYLMYPKPAVVDADLFIPFETETASRRIIVIAPQSGRVRLRVRGPAGVIDRLSRKPPPLHFDHLKADDGVLTLPVRARYIGLPPDLTVVSLRPKTVTIRVQRLVERVLPLVVVPRGIPKDGFAVTGLAVVPGRATVRGPAGLVSALTVIRTRPIDVNGLAATVQHAAALDLPDGVKLVRPERFVARVMIGEKMISRRVGNIPVAGRGCRQACRISPPTLALTVKGPYRTVRNLQNLRGFSVFISLSGLAPGVYIRRAVIDLPVDIILIKAVPELFTVRIGTRKKKSR